MKGLDHKSVDTNAVLATARQSKAIITVKEHSMIGGLGSAVAEVLAELGNSHTTFRRIGIKDEFCRQVGSQEYLRRIYGLSVDGVVDAIKSLVGRGIAP